MLSFHGCVFLLCFNCCCFAVSSAKEDELTVPSLEIHILEPPFAFALIGQ